MIWRNWIRLRTVWPVVPVYLFLARPTLVTLLSGAGLALVGGALRAWAAGTIHKNKVLTTGGPYAHTRNPLYLGTFFIGLGLAAAGGRVAFVVAFLIFFVWIYGWSMRREAQRMEDQFGDQYRAYAARVPMFFPWPFPYKPSEPHPTQFEVNRYVRHREYQTALGLLASFLILAAKLAFS
jgi:protein-S-isoprenylcysteine O-methyltransferase Ste14